MGFAVVLGAQSGTVQIIKHKTATFKLEPDGFSIHTFSLSRQLTQSEYHALKKNLYRDDPDTYKTDSKGEDGTIYIFYPSDILQEKIRASHFKKKNKAAMYKLVELLKKVQSVDKALEKLESKGYDTSGILKKFEKLGISPVPLRKDFCAERLPGLVELLNTVGDKGGIVVPYTVQKYK